MNNTKVKKLVFAALFAALACAATFIHIPVPSMTNGYVNLGDCFVILAGFCLGPVYGGLATSLKKHMPSSVSYTVAAVIGELIMIGGYFLYELCIYGAAAIGSIPGNAVQAVAGLVSSVIIVLILDKNKTTRQMFDGLKGND